MKATASMNGQELYKEIQNLQGALDQVYGEGFDGMSDEDIERATTWEMRTKARLYDLKEALAEWNHKNAAARRVSAALSSLDPSINTRRHKSKMWK